MYIQCMCVIVVMKNPSFSFDFLINTIKIFPCSTICGDVCTVELNRNCTRTRHGQ
jgi:hypothetical protein